MKLELANVKQILELLGLEEAQKKEVLQFAKENKCFAGEAGIRLGFFDKTRLDAALAQQAILKSQAAELDIATIISSGQQEQPKWLKANWGNNGVNPASEEPTWVEGLSALANIAQNFVMVANALPEHANVIAQPCLKSCELLKSMVKADFSSLTDFEERYARMVSEIQAGLMALVDHSKYIPCDANGQPISSIYDFIRERFKEVDATFKHFSEIKPAEKMVLLLLAESESSNQEADDGEKKSNQLTTH